MPNQKKSGLFYGWYIVAACFAIMAVSIGTVNNCSGLFIKPVCESLGFSRSGMAVNNTIIAGSNVCIALLAGKIYTRFDVCRIMRIGGVMMATGYFCYSFCRSLPVFYAVSAVVGIGEALMATVAISIVINNWFHRRRGTAMGAASMGSGVGGMIVSLAAGRMIPYFGWQNTYRILAIAIFLVLVPCFFILRSYPHNKGLLPYGETPQETSTPHELQGEMLRDVQRTPRFWLLCLASGMLTICTSGLMHNVAPHVSDVGYTPVFASAMASACMGTLAFGKTLVGWLYDRIGVRGATLFATSCVAIGMSGALLIPRNIGLVMLILGAGLGGCIGAIATPLIAQMVYGQRDYGAILGRMSAFPNGGAMLAPIFVNWVYDTWGSYKPAFAVMLGVTLFFSVMYLFLFPRRTHAK